MQFGGLNSVLRISRLIRWVTVCFFLYFLAVPRPLDAAQTGATDNPSDAERNAQIQLQLINDAQRTANYKAQLTLLPERARRGEISQQRLPADLQLAQSAVTGEQQKYDALGGDWGRRFSQELQDEAQKIIDETHLTLRLNDQQTPLGIDAHVAARDTIDLDRYAVYREQGAVTVSDGQMVDAIQLRRDALNAKYARSPQGADYRDRVAHLVQQGESEAQKAQWVQKAQQYNATHKQNPFAAIFGSIFAGISNSLSSVSALVHGGPVTSGSQSHSTNPGSVALLVLLLLGGAGYYFLQRSSQKPATISYADLNALSAALPPAESPATPTATPPAPKAPSGPLPPGALKERLFAEEKQKYQARYNDVQDQVTSATAELGRLGKVISGIQDNLKLLGKSVESRVHGMAVSYHSSFAKLARSAALGKPVVRLLKRAGGLLKIVILIGVGWFVLVAANMAINQDWVDLAVMLVGAFAVPFFIERYLQLRAPLVVFRRDGDKFKQLALAYVSEDQAPMPSGAPAYRSMRVLAASKASPTDEPLVSVNSWGAAMRPESFLLYLESMAVYRLDASGAFAPLFANNASEIIQNYGRWITEALNEQKSFAAANLAPLANYAKVALRRRRAADQLPGLEKLVQSVDRLQAIWRDVYVPDKAFAALLQRIDMFNMGKAAPPGILLYGYAGNGKAYLAKKIAESISARVEAIDPASLNSAKAVRDLWEKSRGKDPVVLFVDYAERVFPKLDPKNGGPTRDATLTWMSEWAKFEPRQSRVWVVMTAQSEQDLYEEVLAKFGTSKIEITSPNNAGREMIFRAACREFQVPGPLPEWLIGDTGGSSIHDLQEMVKEVTMLSSTNAPDDEEWRKAVDAVRTVFPRDPTKTWEHLILPADIKGQLQAACRILHDAESYRAVGAEVPNILLYGPSGTGKTEIASAPSPTKAVSSSSWLARPISRPATPGSPRDWFAVSLPRPAPQLPLSFSSMRSKRSFPSATTPAPIPSRRISSPR